MQDLFGKKIILGSLAIIIVLAFVGYVVVQGKLKEPIEDKIAEIQKDLAGVGELEYEKVLVNPITRKVSVKGVEFYDYNTEQIVNVGSINILSVDEESEIPKFLKFSLKNVVVGLEEKDSLFGIEDAFWLEHGFKDSLELDLEVDYVYDEKQEQLNFNMLSLDVEKLGSMDLSLSLGNINLTQEGIVSLMFNWPHLLFCGGDVYFEDEGLVELMLKEDAKGLGMSYTDYREMVLDIVREADSSLSSDRVNSIRENAYNFVKNPQTVLASAYPDRPVQIQRIIQMSGEERLLELLNLEVSSY